MRLLKRDLKIVIKTTLGVMLVVFGYIAVTTPAEAWLPFSQYFPEFLTNQPLAFYFSDLAVFFAISFIIAIFIFVIIGLARRF